MVNGKDIEIEIINRIISKDYFLISKVKKKSSKKQEMWEMNRVVQKLRDVRHEDIPEINNEKIIRPVLEGDKDMKEVDNGGYNVHPVPLPNSEIKERIRKRYEDCWLFNHKEMLLMNDRKEMSEM